MISFICPQCEPQRALDGVECQIFPRAAEEIYQFHPQLRPAVPPPNPLVHGVKV